MSDSQNKSLIINNSQLIVAVVILNWNGRSQLEQFLPHVLASTYPNLQIVVGDNGSTDDSVDFLYKHYPSIRIIINERNEGYAGGYNKVLKQVEADYVVLLNADVEVSPNWIQPLIAAMEADKTIAAAQPKIKDFNRRNYFEYAGAAGGYLDYFGFPFCRGRVFNTLEEDLGQYDDQRSVFWASGAALFLRKKEFDAIGGFDADLFAHMEEIDLCWRLKNKGKKVIYCPESSVYHVGGATLAKGSPFKTYLNFRNNLFILCKNLRTGLLIPILLARLWLDLAAWFQFIFKGDLQSAFAISRAHIQFFLQLPSWLKKRKPMIGSAQNPGFWNGSIVWTYFIRGKKRFSDLSDFR